MSPVVPGFEYSIPESRQGQIGQSRIDEIPVIALGRLMMPVVARYQNRCIRMMSRAAAA